MPDVEVGEGCLYDGTAAPTFAEGELAARDVASDSDGLGAWGRRPDCGARDCCPCEKHPEGAALILQQNAARRRTTSAASLRGSRAYLGGLENKRRRSTG